MDKLFNRRISRFCCSLISAPLDLVRFIRTTLMLWYAVLALCRGVELEKKFIEKSISNLKNISLAKRTLKNMYFPIHNEVMVLEGNH